MWNAHLFPFANLRRVHSLIKFILSILPSSGWQIFMQCFELRWVVLIHFYHPYPQRTSKTFLLSKGEQNKRLTQTDNLITELLVENECKLVPLDFYLLLLFWFSHRCPVLNVFYWHKDERTMVRCGFSRFVTDSCGQSIASSECVSLSQCTRDIGPHPKSLNVIDASLILKAKFSYFGREQELIRISYLFHCKNFRIISFSIRAVSTAPGNYDFNI